MLPTRSFFFLPPPSPRRLGRIRSRSVWGSPAWRAPFVCAHRGRSHRHPSFIEGNGCRGMRSSRCQQPEAFSDRRTSPRHVGLVTTCHSYTYPALFVGGLSDRDVRPLAGSATSP